MKAKLEFDLPEDNSEFVLATNGLNFWSVLWELDQRMRELLKHGELDESAYNVINNLRERLYDDMQDNGINFNMVD